MVYCSFQAIRRRWGGGGQKTGGAGGDALNEISPLCFLEISRSWPGSLFQRIIKHDIPVGIQQTAALSLAGFCFLLRSHNRSTPSVVTSTSQRSNPISFSFSRGLLWFFWKLQRQCDGGSLVARPCRKKSRLKRGIKHKGCCVDWRTLPYLTPPDDSAATEVWNASFGAPLYSLDRIVPPLAKPNHHHHHHHPPRIPPQVLFLQMAINETKHQSPRPAGRNIRGGAASLKWPGSH